MAITETQITTAARRITRTANAAGRCAKLYFAADGELLGQVETGHTYATRPDWADEIVVTVQTVGSTPWHNGRVTQRGIQDQLDAYTQHAAHADTCTQWADVCQGAYLQQLDYDREAGRLSPTNTTHSYPEPHYAAPGSSHSNARDHRHTDAQNRGPAGGWEGDQHS